MDKESQNKKILNNENTTVDETSFLKIGLIVCFLLLLITFFSVYNSDASDPAFEEEIETTVESPVIQKLNKFINECEVSTQVSDSSSCENLYDSESTLWLGSETYCEGASIKTVFNREVNLAFFIIKNPEQSLSSGKYYRPRRIKFTLEGASPNNQDIYTYLLDDIAETQWIEVENTEIKSITIDVTNGYGPPEGRGDYCAIEEIEFFGWSEYEPYTGKVLSKSLSKNYINSQNPEVNINPCNESIGLYENTKYKIDYSFHGPPKRFQITFTDPTGDLHIDLLQKIESQKKNNQDISLEKGYVYLDLYAETESLDAPNVMTGKIIAEDIYGNKSFLSCTYDLYTINLNEEGDFRRAHIRSTRVRDELYISTVKFTGLVWEQNYESIEECVSSSTIEWHVDDANEYLLDDLGLEEPITPEQYCISDVEDPISYFPTEYTHSFTYPVISEDTMAFGTYGKTLVPVGECTAKINDEIFDFIQGSTKAFGRGVFWGDRGMDFMGDYRLVGINTKGRLSVEQLEDPDYPRDESPLVGSWVMYDGASFPDSTLGIGHRNTLPEKSFHLSEYGMVDKQPIRYISYIFTIFTYTGGNHGMYQYITFNYDLDDCRRIYLQDIMTDNKLMELGYHPDSSLEDASSFYDTSENPDALWLNLLAARLGDIWSVSESNPGFRQLQGISYETMSAMSLNDNGITISFQPYDLACWACGWPEISISWANLWDIFTWGDWNSRNSELYPDTIISDELLQTYLDGGSLIEYEYYLEDLLYGSTHVYSTGYSWGEGTKEYKIYTSPIVKQPNQTTYGLTGGFTLRDEAIVEKFVSVVNRIIGKEYFSYSQNIDDTTVPIDFSPCLISNMWDSMLIDGAESCDSTYGTYFEKSNSIWVQPNLFGVKRDSTIIHELLHSIGLNHTSCGNEGVVSTETREHLLEFSDYEIAMIKFLYTPFSLTEEDITTFKEIERGATFDDLLQIVEEGWEHPSPRRNPDDHSVVVNARYYSEYFTTYPESGICFSDGVSLSKPPRMP